MKLRDVRQRYTLSWLSQGCWWLAACLLIAQSARSNELIDSQKGPVAGVVASSLNDDPSRFPQLRAWVNPPYDVYLAATFPNVPNLVLDAWVYELANYQGVDRLDLLDISVPGSPRQNCLNITYRVHDYPGVKLITRFTATPGCVEAKGEFETDPNAPPGSVPRGPQEEALLLEKVKPTTLCWSFDRGSAFSPNGKHVPESHLPENYPEWIHRCFIFTQDGQTFLDHTVRRKSTEPWLADDSPQQTKPFCWSQHYVGEWQDPLHGPFPANTSTTRYAYRLIGAVSRDSKYLIALAADDAMYSAQAWNTCLHHVPVWNPKDAPLARRAWRMKLYAM
jgi:hypothetical protein